MLLRSTSRCFSVGKGKSTIRSEDCGFEKGRFVVVEGTGFGLDLVEFVEVTNALFAVHFLIDNLVANEYVFVHGRY